MSKNPELEEFYKWKNYAEKVIGSYSQQPSRGVRKCLKYFLDKSMEYHKQLTEQGGCSQGVEELKQKLEKVRLEMEVNEFRQSSFTEHE